MADSLGIRVAYYFGRTRPDSHQRDGLRRWSGIAGIVFVVLAVVSRLVRGSVPDPEAHNAVAKFTRY